MDLGRTVSSGSENSPLRKGGFAFYLLSLANYIRFFFLNYFWLGESLSSLISVGLGLVWAACPVYLRFPVGEEGEIPGP